MTIASTFPALGVVARELDARVRSVVDAHHDGLWRFLRRMGVPEATVEDAVQQVLLVFARRAGEVEAGAERSFVYGVALRVASDARRRDLRGRERPDEARVLEHPDPGPDAEARLGHEQLRRLLDAALARLPDELRAVFVLAELEELTMATIAKALSIPPGTVASRLRRARHLVEVELAALGVGVNP